jgi:DNA-binding transcriptional LysR family regulator
LSVSDTLTDIVAERFDAGIRLGERIERDMIAVRVTDELPLVVAGSPAYFEQRGKPKTPDDLVGHDCVRIRFSSGTYVPWRFRVKRPDLEVHVEGRLSVNSVAVARQAAIEGLALVQTPPIFIAVDLAARGLVTVLDEWAPTPATGFFLYYPRSPNATGAQGLGGFSAQGTPRRVPGSLAMNRQEIAMTCTAFGRFSLTHVLPRAKMHSVKQLQTQARKQLRPDGMRR